MGVVEDALQEDLSATAPPAQQQPLDRLNVTDERRMNDIGTNTSDVVVESTRDRTRTLNMEENAQTSIPIVDVFLPSGQGDHVMIPHVNLSISGYEQDSLRTSGMRSPSMQAQEVSAIPQVDGPGSLPMRDHIERWMNGITRLVEKDSSQRGTYVQRAPVTREYPGGSSNSDGPRRPHRDQKPPNRGRYPNRGGRPPDQGGYLDGGPPGEDIQIEMGDPLEEEDTLAEDLLMEEDPLGLLVDKDHLALRDHLDQ